MGALPAIVVGFGVVLIAAGALFSRRHQDEDLARVLDLPFGERDVDVTAVTERPAIQHLTAFGDRIVTRFDHGSALAQLLELAKLPLRPGEYVAGVAALTVVTGGLVLAVTDQWLFAVGAVLAEAWGSIILLRARAAQRRRRLEGQLPDALTVIAGSMDAGHSFQRALQMLQEEVGAPLSEELDRALQESALGGSLVDGLDHMAARLDIEDLRWMVQAIRIQQSVGGKLADVLRTLSDFMRARDEVRREVRALSAEGRMSAWVLGLMPVFLIVALQSANPGYLDPMLQGWGLMVSAACTASVATGVLTIVRMVKIEV
jgi:tight adherence protein B